METSQLAQVLRDKGYRLTPQRVEVINLVMEKLAKKEHPTFNDILDRGEAEDALYKRQHSVFHIEINGGERICGFF